MIRGNTQSSSNYFGGEGFWEWSKPMIELGQSFGGGDDYLKVNRGEARLSHPRLISRSWFKSATRNNDEPLRGLASGPLLRDPREKKLARPRHPFSWGSSDDRDGCAMISSQGLPVHIQTPPIKMAVLNPLAANATQWPAAAKYPIGSVQFHRRKVPVNGTRIRQTADRRAGKVRQRIAKCKSTS